MFDAFFHPVDKVRKRCQKTVKMPNFPSNLLRFYNIELPNENTLLRDCRLIALDFETTGLNFEHDTVLSVGGISIENGGIDFSSSFHHLLKNPVSVKKQTAVINMLTPEQLAKGEDPAEVMNALMDMLAGAVVITHCGIIESTFLKKAIGLTQEMELPMIFADTFNIERKLHQPTGRKNEYSLSEIRKRRNFPTYEAHNALWDSIATAELFLAQVKELFGKEKPRLLEVYRYSH